ncbi:hypothetical protein J4209_01240 [Candidatus Woesearchaeota archaeon]|nr:hypothetical protein [Candidatus Woesearchaeota archaeon]
MRSKIKIEKKHVYFLTAIILAVIGVSYVIAYGGTSPATVGHSAGELDLTPLYIDAVNGNVGIGTTSPGGKLQVDDSSTNYAALFYQNGAGYGIYIKPGSDDNSALTIQNSLNTLTRHAFYGSGNVALALGAGNVGIGTTSPATKLHVAQSPAGTDLVRIEGGYLKFAGGHFGIRSEANDFVIQTGADNTERIRVTSGGNVGIGTTSPAEKLDVAGNIKGTGLCIGTDCRTSWPSGGSSQWSTTGSSIYYNNGNVGIGTAEPVHPLHIYTSNANPIVVEQSVANQNMLIQFKEVGTWKWGIGFRPNNKFVIWGQTAGDVVNIDGNGYFGIGTSSPGAKLDVIANSGVVAAKFKGGGGTDTLYVQNSDNTAALVVRSNGNVGIGSSSPQYKLDVEGTVQATQYLTGDIIFQKDKEKLWRMFEDEDGLYLESLKTGKRYSFVLQEIDNKRG